MTEETESSSEARQRPILYPTLVIGLGGTGAQVVRHVKRRFRRMWEAASPSGKRSGIEQLPALIQLLVVDTEPLVNRPGEEYLQQSEYAYLGGFDAARLIKHVRTDPERRPEIAAWWKYGTGELPLGYIHTGAKQLRPLGRLAFFRNYVTFKERFQQKADSVLTIRDKEKAQERQFPVVQDYYLVFIVTSLCGGTGAGMIVDVSNWVKAYFRHTAKVIGIMLMPSVFDNTINSNLQRRRIRANAYAALKEINAFQLQEPSFEVRYPSESADTSPPYRPFDNLYLIERINRRWRTLQDERQAAHLVAHMINLMSASYMSKTILGLDVNIEHDPVRAQARDKQAGKPDQSRFKGTALFSSFGASALAMPVEATVRYVQIMIARAALERFVYGEYATRMAKEGSRGDARRELEDYAGLAHRELKAELGTRFTRGTERKSAKALGNIKGQILDRTALWEGLAGALAGAVQRQLRTSGLSGACSLLQRLEPDVIGRESGRLSGTDLWQGQEGEIAQAKEAIDSERKKGSLAKAVEAGGQVLAADAGRIEGDRQRRADDEAIVAREDVADTTAREVCKDASKLYRQLQEQLRQARDANDKLEEMLAKTSEAFDPHKGSHLDPSVSTLYNLETGACDAEFPQQFWTAEVERHVGEEVKRIAGTLVEDLKLDRQLVVKVRDAAGIGRKTGAEVRSSNEISEQVRARMSITWVVEQQKKKAEASKRPDAENNRIRQMFERVDPFCPTDFDAHPFNEADLEPIPVVATPDERRDNVPELAELMRDWWHFDWVGNGGDHSRLDAAYIVHGYPLWSIYKLDELYQCYVGDEFVQRTLHVIPGAEDFGEVLHVEETDDEADASSATGP